MRKVIDGKAYDTATATLLAEAENPSADSTDDIRYWAEELYRTPAGRYFLRGNGGPMSGWGSGPRIRVLTESAACRWIERWAGSEYEKIFGPAEEA